VSIETKARLEHAASGGLCVLRHVDQSLVAAGILKASGDQVMHAKAAYIAERHRLAG